MASVRLFRDGELWSGPETIVGAAKTSDVPWDLDEPASWEVHEENADGSFSVLSELVHLRPEIRWGTRASDARYVIHHRESEGGTEELLLEVSANPEVEELSATPDDDLAGQGALKGQDGVWHFFRVEAVTEEGVESTRALWPAFVRDQPAGPQDISVAGAAGTFTVTLTA